MAAEGREHASTVSLNEAAQAREAAEEMAREAAEREREVAAALRDALQGKAAAEEREHLATTALAESNINIVACLHACVGEWVGAYVTCVRAYVR